MTPFLHLINMQLNNKQADDIWPGERENIVW